MRRHEEMRRLTKRKRKLFVLASAWVYLAMLSPALGVEAVLHGRAITFEPPQGYCLLDGLTDGERQTLDAMRRLQRPDHDLLWMFVRCEQIAGLRAGQDGRLEQFGYVTAVQPNGRSQPVRGATRFDFATKLARTLPPLDAAGMARELRQRPVMQNAPRFSLLHSGLAAADAAAVYLGIVLEENWGRSRSVTAGVTAITLIKDIPVAVTLHGPFSGISYPILRTELRPLIGDFITRNEPGAQPFERAAPQPRSVTEWWSRFPLFAGITLLAGIVCGAALLFATRRSRGASRPVHQPPHAPRMPSRAAGLTRPIAH